MGIDQADGGSFKLTVNVHYDNYLVTKNSFTILYKADKVEV